MGLRAMMEIASSLNFLVSCFLLLMSFPISQLKQKDESISDRQNIYQLIHVRMEKNLLRKENWLMDGKIWSMEMKIVFENINF